MRVSDSCYHVLCVLGHLTWFAIVQSNMALSFAYLCSRDEASSEYERLKKDGLLNLDLKPMPYGDFIAIPVLKGELELDFQEVERHNPHELSLIHI